MDFTFMLLIAFLLAAFAAVLGLLFVYYSAKPYPDLEPDSDTERHFYNAETDTQERFPSIRDEPSLTLTVIVPAYREEERLGKMLDEALPFLDARRKRDSTFSYEIIIVDGGSDDSTDKVALDYSRRFGTGRVRFMQLTRNRGKGGAVRCGALAARGRLVLFADADGATKFEDLLRLEQELKDCYAKEGPRVSALICGSRAHLEQADDVVAQRTILRALLTNCFHALVWLCCVRNVKDTQCGFKLLTRDAARLLFSNLHVERWAFDCDLLYLANRFGVTIREVPVNWTEIDGSHLVPVFSWLQMAIDIVLIRLRYLMGAWKVKSWRQLQ